MANTKHFKRIRWRCCEDEAQPVLRSRVGKWSSTRVPATSWQTGSGVPQRTCRLLSYTNHCSDLRCRHRQWILVVVLIGSLHGGLDDATQSSSVPQDSSWQVVVGCERQRRVLPRWNFVMMLVRSLPRAATNWSIPAHWRWQCRASLENGHARCRCLEVVLSLPLWWQRKQGWTDARHSFSSKETISLISARRLYDCTHCCIKQNTFDV